MKHVFCRLGSPIAVGLANADPKVGPNLKIENNNLYIRIQSIIDGEKNAIQCLKLIIETYDGVIFTA
jgi:hypothetical protein